MISALGVIAHLTPAQELIVGLAGADGCGRRDGSGGVVVVCVCVGGRGGG